MKLFENFYLVFCTLLTLAAFAYFFWSCGEARAQTLIDPQHYSLPDGELLNLPHNLPDGGDYACHCPEKAQSHTYMLYTRSYGGTVSLNKGLTREECEEAKKISYAWKALAPGDTWKSFVQSGDIVSASCFELKE